MIITTAIICHGLHLNASDWNIQIWGDVNSQRMGRIPRAIFAALEFRAEAIFFGSGASRSRESGKIESQVIVDLLISKINQLRKFELIDNFLPQKFNLYSWIKKRIRYELNSFNTMSELTHYND